MSITDQCNMEGLNIMDSDSERRELCKIFSHFYRNAEEHVVPEETVIQGSLPKWLQGDFYRTGPGVFDFGEGFTMNHFFDGYTVVSKFSIANGKITHEKKILQSDAYKKAMASGKPCISEFGTKAYSDSTKSLLSRVFNTIVPEFTDNCSVNLFTIGQCLFVAAETCYFHCLNPKTVQTIGKMDTNKLFGLHSASPHPITDRDGITYNMGSCYAPTLKYCVIKVPPPNGTKDAKEIFKKSKILGSIPTRWSRNGVSYFHSFGLTLNYIVFIEQPYIISLTKILASVLTKGTAFKEWVDWCPQYTNKFYIMDKRTGKVVNKTEFFSEKPFFFMHIINCYEDQDQIVLTVSSYPDPSVFDTQYLDTLRSGGCDDDGTRAEGHQYVIPLNIDLGGGKIKNDSTHQENLVLLPGSKATAYKQGNHVVLSPEILTKKGLEFPTLNRERIGLKNRFYYASGLTSVGLFKNSVCKIDVDRHLTHTWVGDEHKAYGEATFVPNPDVDYEDSSQEDNGVLIVPSSDYRGDSTDVIMFLNPKDMTEIARAEFRTQITPSIHGLFVPSY